MADQDTSHAWSNDKTRCTVCGVDYNEGAAFYPCIGDFVHPSAVRKIVEKPEIDWFALNRSGG